MFRKKIGPGMGLGLAMALVTAGLYVLGVPLIELVELKAVDLRVRSAVRPTTRLSDVAVVAVDERSLAALGQWAWPRTVIARLIEATLRAGARVVAVDVGFFEPQTLFTRRDVERLRQQPGLDPGRLPGPDDVLARTIGRAKGRVILGYFFHMSAAQVGPLTPVQMKARTRLIRRFQYTLVRSRPPRAVDRAPFITAYAPQPIIAPLARAAGRGGAGHFNVFPDYDGTIRRVPLVIRQGRKFYPSMIVAATARYLRAPLTMVQVGPAGVNGVRLGRRPIIPTDRYGQMLIHYQGPANVVPTYSAVDVLRGRVAKGLRGRLVFIGTTAVGTFEQRVTPMSPVAPGVTIQARAAQNVLSGRHLIRPVWARAFDLALILVLGLGLGLALFFVPPWLGALISAAVYAAVVWAAFALFQGGFIIAVIYPLLAVVLTFGAVVVWRHFTQGREKKRLRGAFQSYVHPDVVRAVTENPDRLGLHGEKRDLTVLMSDIRSFTTLSESLDPHQLAHILNLYMDVMTEIVFDHGGLLDKYIGDAIMAVWGAPLASDDHARAACAAALDMQAALPRVQEMWAEYGVDGPAIGIGINTGLMIVGNMGSSRRFDYTVIGDEVNVAARLEGETKTYDLPNVVGQSTVERCREFFHFRPLDMVRLRGRTTPTILYTLIGPQSQPEPQLAVLCRLGFEALGRRDWPAALQFYQDAHDLAPGDRAVTTILSRLRDFVHRPPPEGWDWVPEK